MIAEAAGAMVTRVKLRGYGAALMGDFAGEKVFCDNGRYRLVGLQGHVLCDSRPSECRKPRFIASVKAPRPIAQVFSLDEMLLMALAIRFGELADVAWCIAQCASVCFGSLRYASLPRILIPAMIGVASAFYLTFAVFFDQRHRYPGAKDTSCVSGTRWRILARKDRQNANFIRKRTPTGL